MSDEQQAMAWLKELSEGRVQPCEASYPHRMARIALAMLAEPRMPEEPDAQTINAIRGAWINHQQVQRPTDSAWQTIYRALRAHLAGPSPKADAPQPDAPPIHVDIGHTNTSPNRIIEACVEVLVRMGKMTVGGSIGDRINARINPPAKAKMVWQLVGWPGHVEIGRNLVCGYDDVVAAEGEAMKWLRAGGSVQSLRQVEVPA